MWEKFSITTRNSVGTPDFHPKVLDSPVRGDGRVCIEAIAKHMCYSYGVNRMIRIGDFSRLSRVSIKTLRWIEANGYKISGPNREIYLYCTEQVRQDDDSYVTEIQFPVEKREK